MRGVLPVRGRVPSNCIYIEAAENTDKVRISGGERYAKVYNIDYNGVSSADTAWKPAH